VFLSPPAILVQLRRQNLHQVQQQQQHDAVLMQLLLQF
jgi:hypothetical protein